MKKIISSAIFLSFLIASCGSKEKTTNEIPKVEVIPVKLASLQVLNSNEEIHVSGQFTTDDETYLSFLSGGVIQKLFVREGDKVQKGQLLATLDLTLVKATVSQAKLGLEKSKRDLERAKNLQKEGFATLEQMQNAQTAVDVAEEQLQSALFNLKYAEIRAVSNGFILRKMANQGQLVSSGTPVFQTNGAGSSSFKLKVGVSDRQWSQIKIGDEAEIESDVFRNQTVKAVVSRKSESIDPFSGTFTVELELKGKAPQGLASGVFGKAIIHLSETSENWKIPYEALLDGNADEGYVFISNDKKTVKKVAVKIDNLNQNVVEVSEGLEGYKFVIVSGGPYLNENSTISVK
ncbi:efflux RND transporter periplasmic adaptor subunit [Fluviicola taffensis]|uniref:Efflux transporter, RND family, MFP subunit n=1 Tax=Fluviicola taffensis (strain DSM 16823 / NCIMB 13979 / RW262) TaxID=755732 RepID=F2IEK5_FLUTR|nr:efflux RND transporter periplasmic adaptor subunit [Fluviicola taffensis]AEA44544.1 efflux transporter, RND family, MFP subunit [Fluviicola taffensis DSM 16823]